MSHYNHGLYGWISVTGHDDQVTITVRRKANHWTARPVDLVAVATKVGALGAWDTLREVDRQWDGDTLSDIYVCQVERHAPDLIAWLDKGAPAS